MPKLRDLTGQRFGALTVGFRSGAEYPVRWICHCDCGSTIECTNSALREWKTSCGCIQKDRKRKPAKSNLIGQKFNKLTVVDVLQEKPGGMYKWVCICDCGNRHIVSTSLLTTGGTKSCGCLRKDNPTLMKTRHGKSSRSEWNIWSAMKQRCSNPKNQYWHLYGGKGIKVCERWQFSFENFFEDMGARPSKNHSIDRINSNGNYEPGNCRWATAKEQARNMSVNKLIEFNGEVKCLAEWAEQYQISADAIGSRLKRGWSVHKAITTPIKKRSRPKN